MRILALESSCDEMAASLVEDGRHVLASSVASQISLHRHFGGVVPEIASRKHVEALIPVLDSCLDQVPGGWEAVDALAVTAGPGLVGSLLVAVTAAKALALALNKPLYGIHHNAGHIAANYLCHEDFSPPFICLVASGGHSHIVYCADYGQFELLGRSRDDAAGEAFDKVARVLGLPYPGGPEIDRLAQEGRADAFTFPEAKLGASLDFSFSGLKTYAINRIHQAEQRGETLNKADFAASFQRAVVQTLCHKALEACRQKGLRRLALAGGVAANRQLRERLAAESQALGLDFYCPELRYCTDNADMIGAAAYYYIQAGAPPADSGLNARASWSLEDFSWPALKRVRS